MWRLVRLHLRLHTVLSSILLAALAGAALAQEPSWPRLINSDREPQNWMSYGGNYSAHRFSALDQVNRENVKQLVPVWMFHTGELQGGLNATPIVVDGVMYLMGPR
jgi:glucose dehydrogenase